MSRISQGFINDVACLYEEINIQQNDFLNEESEYYDQEVAELVEDIILSLALSMFSEGCNAESFIKFLANTEEDIIIERYLSTNIDFILEEKIYSNFIEEQLELLEFAGLVKLLGRGVKAIASGAKATKGAIKTGVTKAATAGVESKIGRKLVTNKGPNISGPFKNVSGRTGSASDRRSAALERLARIKATRAGVNVPKGSLNPTQATELIKQARTAKALKGVKSAAKNVGLVGLGAAGGYLGAKMGGAGEQKPSGSIRTDQSSTPTPAPPRRDNPPTPPAAPGGGSGAPSGGGGGRATTPSGGAGGAGRSTSQRRTPQPSGQTGDKEKDMETWARANPTLAARVKPGQAGYETISRLRDKPSDYEKQDQTPTQGSTTAQIDPSSVQASIEAEKERMRKRAEQKNNTSTTTTAKESYEPYDIILEYLIGRGHADSIDEANYIMMEMDQNAIGIIMQEYNDYLLAEDVSDWVNDLVEEGYDLSDYTWDDMVEYYVNEANRAERELNLSPRKREISRNLRYKNLHVKPSKRKPDSDFYKPENLKAKPKNTYSGDESDSWHDSMSQARRVRSKVNKT
jgi:hypothetical protein